MRILVVEDDFVSQKVLGNFLGAFGEVVVAGNGRIGIDKIAEAHAAHRPFDLVTLDVMMPEVDGQQVLVRLRDIEKATGQTEKTRARVLMTTALDDLQNVKSAYENLCDGYLKKPVRKATLYETLQKLGFAMP